MNKSQRMPSNELTVLLRWSSVKNASLIKWMRRCGPSMALLIRGFSKLWWQKQFVTLRPWHYCLMILSAIIQRWFTVSVTSVCVCLYICAYVSHKKEDTRTESALLFSNELRSPAVSLSDWREQVDTDGTVDSRIVRHSRLCFYPKRLTNKRSNKPRE